MGAVGNTNASAGGQVRVHVFFMQQPNGLPVSGYPANIDSNWRTSIPDVGVSIIVRTTNSNTNRQQVQARHWFRPSANHTASMTMTAHSIRNP